MTKGKPQLRYGLIALCIYLLLGIIGYSASSRAAAGIVAKPADGFVVDDAGVLTQDTMNEMNRLGEETDYSTGTAVVLITVDYTGTYAIDEYVDQVFDDWGIEDGLVLVMAIGAEDYYAIASVGLSEYLRASDIQEILDTELEPDFAAADYDAGAKKVYTAFCEKIEELYQQYGIKPEDSGQESVIQPEGNVPEEPVREGSSFRRGMRNLVMVIFWIFVIVILVVIFASLFGRRRGGYHSGYYGPGMPPPPRRRFFGPPRPRAPRPPRPPRPPRAPRPPAGRGPGRPSGPAGGRGFGSPGRSSGVGRSSGAGRSSGGRSSSGRGGGFGGGGSRGGGAGRRR